MTRFTPFLLASVLFAAAAHAGEITIQPKPFFSEQTFSATALPTEATLIRLNPTAWAEFEITQLAAHGSLVAAGDILVKLDAEAIDKKLADANRTLGADELSLAQAELEYQSLTETTPRKLESIRRAARDAKEENDYFTKTRRKAAEEGAEQDLKRAK